MEISRPVPSLYPCLLMLSHWIQWLVGRELKSRVYLKFLHHGELYSEPLVWHTHTKRQCFRITLSTAISALEKAGYWQSCLSMIARTALSTAFLPTQDAFFFSATRIQENQWGDDKVPFKMAQKDHGFSSNGEERITYKLGGKTASFWPILQDAGPPPQTKHSSLWGSHERMWCSCCMVQCYQFAWWDVATWRSCFCFLNGKIQGKVTTPKTFEKDILYLGLKSKHYQHAMHTV